MLVQLHKGEGPGTFLIISNNKEHGLKTIEEMDDMLDQVTEELYDYKCYNLSTECLYYHSYILNMIAEDSLMSSFYTDENRSLNYKRCRKKLTRCMAQCRVFD